MRIAITGIGIISALGTGRQATLDALLHEQSGIVAPVILPTRHSECPVGEVRLSDAALKERLELSPDTLIPRTSLLGLAAAREALADAGVSDTHAVAFVNGTTVGGMDMTEQRWREREAHAQTIVTHHTAGASTEAIAGHIGAFATQQTISTACSSALNAVMTGCNMLRTGACTQVLAGGAESLSLFHFNGFRALQILSDDICRPFAATRKGLNLGEGAAYVLLETEESAMQRGADIYGYIAGYGNACDAYHQTASSDNGEGAYRAMQQALLMAQVEPTAVDYINAHGTATPNNDATEYAAMQRLFGSQMPAYSSTKAFTGHATSAAGSIELVISLLAMQHGFVPASMHIDEPMPDTIPPVQHTMHKDLSFVLCNSFGFGGNDSSMLLSKMPAELTAVSDAAHAQTMADVHLTGQADYKQYISPMQARRLTPALRQLVVAARQALEQAQLEMPDAIITATDLGCICHSVGLLDQLTDEGEDSLSPTLFMQSTHNTPSSLIAILLHAHGYNCTYSHGAASYEQAMDDARRQISLGLISNALVLAFDEEDSTWQTLMQQAGKQYAPIIRATVLGA